MIRKKPHYHGHRERLRERFDRDPKGLAEYEVLELLLAHVIRRQDTKPLAKALLERFETLRGVLSARPEELLETKGVGPALVNFCGLLTEVRARFAEAPLAQRPSYNCTELGAMAVERLGNKSEEEFWVALLDNSNRIVGWHQLSSGTVDETAVYPREVFRLALEKRAAGVVLVHNHPGGSPEPSLEDERLTSRIIRAGRDLGVAVLDHVIVGETDFYSFTSHDMM